MAGVTGIHIPPCQTIPGVCFGVRKLPNQTSILFGYDFRTPKHNEVESFLMYNLPVTPDFIHELVFRNIQHTPTLFKTIMDLYLCTRHADFGLDVLITHKPSVVQFLPCPSASK